MIKMIDLTILHEPSVCSILIRQGFLHDPLLIEKLTSLATRFVIITDNTVASLHGRSLMSFLKLHHLQVDLLSFPSGEEHKTRDTKVYLEDQMLEKKCGKDTCIIALGGGITTDVAGYVAATYCRGIPLVTIPTSLLGMSDASLGGKVGVNVPLGKNMIGCFYQPKYIFIDPDVLKTLPKKELQNGLVEMIKHGLIADKAYFDFLDSHIEHLLNLDLPILETAILRSAQIKLQIVQEDEKEISGKRHLFNFGHTLGHALETLTSYELSHGEAVAIGLATESYLSMKLGYLQKTSFDNILSILNKVGCLKKLNKEISLDEMLETLMLDKKSKNGNPRFVLLDEIGSARGPPYCSHTESTPLKEALDWMNAHFVGGF